MRPVAPLRRAALAGLALLAATAATAPAATASSPPASGTLAFDVLRKGRDIGDHSFRFATSGGTLTVEVRTEVSVRVPVIGIAAYTFTHTSTEGWQGGRLVRLTAATNDDGTPHQLALGQGADLLPASLWGDEVAGAAQLLNTIDGHIMAVRVADLGTETVETGHGPIPAHHYRITGDLEREVWYDGDGLLARLVMSAEDGSTVTYVRR